MVDASGVGLERCDYNSDEVSPLSLRLFRRTVIGASNRKALPSTALLVRMVSNFLLSA